MDRVLITGGTGCIGSNLAARLTADGYRVRILRRSTSDPRVLSGINVEQVVGDIRDPQSLAAALQDCDTVFHTAALVTFAARRREEQHQINVIGTRNVINACLAARVRKLVHVSSVATIGSSRTGEPATEETPFNWSRTPGYKLSKLLAEEEVRTGLTRGLDAVIVNPSVIIGERDIHFHGGQLIRDMKRGVIPFYIDGGMNIVYVGDVVSGIIQAAKSGRKGERYILSGDNLTHKEIFLRTAALVQGRAPIGRLPISLLHAGAVAIESFCNMLRVHPWISVALVENAGRFNWFSCEKARRELGSTITPFDQTILAAYRWYRDNGYL
jgi:dihydroflavonol-4-reductase